MFYFNYVRLCNEKGLSPSAAAENMGFQRSVVTRWSKGSIPRTATLQKIADYFGVSLEELVNEKEKPADQVVDGLTEEEIEYLRWYREKASERDKALIRMIVRGDK